jgi:hypothetical protein
MLSKMMWLALPVAAIVPVKAWVRKAEWLEVSDMVTVRLAVDV